MIGYEELQNELKKSIIHNCYVFCGMEEQLIKEGVKAICDKTISGGFSDLNYAKFDGTNVEFETILNACETMPFMNDKKVVVIYRANFLSDNKNKPSGVEGDDGILKSLSKYMDNLPQHCILIMYYVYQGDREKISNKVKKLQQKVCVGEFNKLKGMMLEKKVKLKFDEMGKDIGRAELSLFCSTVDNNMEVATNEIEKLCAYTLGREIKKEDIIFLLPRKSDNDIFDLVDFISQKKAEKALGILNELIFRGEKSTVVLSMIERQFKLIFLIKLGLESGKTKDNLSSELKLHPYICEKMIMQSRKFTTKGLQKALMSCLETEKTLKSSSFDDKTEMELLIINTLTA
ncbi:MAG: DNA polymerase III subunit delta [Clostridiaceae bacterium]|nr:DNA polymerase III subunit delta [Clostridiaceae bacterium]